MSSDSFSIFFFERKQARETGMMLNLMPYNAEEAKSLIPTLERFDDDLVR